MHVFNIPGNYDYRCNPHFSMGMTGKIFVQPKVYTLTVNFKNMSPHVGQQFTLYVRDQSTRQYLDTIFLAEITQPDFSLQSFVIQPGGSYWLDFYADLNHNGEYDSPPADHAWRLSVSNVQGDTAVEFTHNTNFTDIFSTAGNPENFYNDQVLLYPNPAKDYITVELKQEGANLDGVKILDLLGKELISSDPAGSNYQRIDVSGLNPGVYLMQVETGSKNRILKFVIR
jgi:hypothetical protein